METRGEIMRSNNTEQPNEVPPREAACDREPRCLVCDAPAPAAVCGRKQPCPACGFPYPLGDCSDLAEN